MKETLQQLAEALALLPGTDREHARALGIPGSHLSAWYGVLDGRLTPNERGQIGAAKYRAPRPSDVQRARTLVLAHKINVCAAMAAWEG